MWTCPTKNSVCEFSFTEDARQAPGYTAKVNTDKGTVQVLTVQQQLQYN